MATTFDPSIMPEVENYTRLAALLKNTKAATKYMADKGIDLTKNFTQSDYLGEILEKQILTTKVPSGYLTTSEELAAKQAAQRSAEQLEPQPPVFKQNKLMEELDFYGNKQRGATALNFSNEFADVEWGKTMAFVGKHSIGVGLAAVSAGGIGLVASVAASYAISVVTRKVVFAILEHMGVMNAIREALTGLLKKLSNALGFDKLKEKAPMLGKAALCVAAAVTLTVMLTGEAEAATLISTDAPKSLSDTYHYALGGVQSDFVPSPAMTDLADKALEDASNSLVNAPNTVSQQQIFAKTVMEANGASAPQITTFTDALAKNQGFEGMMKNIGDGAFKDYESLANAFSDAEPAPTGEFSLLKEGAEVAPTPVEPTTPQPVGANTVLSNDGLKQVTAEAKAQIQEQATQVTQAAQETATKAVEQTVTTAKATTEFTVESLNPVELEIKHSVWRTYENYIQAQGIEFASEAEANQAYVDFMQEIARLNPDVESIHNVDAGQVMKFPEIKNIETARAVMDDIEVTADNNVLSTHAPTEGMVAAEKARITPEVTPKGDAATDVSTAATANSRPDGFTPTANHAGSVLTQKMSFSEMDTEMYEAATGESVGFIFEDDVNDKAKVLAEHLVSKVDQSNFSQIEKDFAKSVLEESIAKNTTVAMANEGKIFAPVTFTDLDMARFASTVDNEFVGQWVLENGRTYTEANFYMDSKGIVRNATSIEQVAASIAQELHDRGDVDMTNSEVAEAYNNILESIKKENGITGVEIKLDEIKIPEDMQSDLKDERIVQVREKYETRFSPRNR